MASFVKFDSRPRLRRPVLIEGLPGIGGVGKLVADFLADELGAERMARIYSEHLPPHLTVDDECKTSMACQEIRYVERDDGDLVFLLGDYQGSSLEGQFILSETVFRMILEFDPSMVITLAGYGDGEERPSPRVLGAVSDTSMKPRLESCGVTFSPGEPEGGVVGAAAALVGLGEAYGVDSVCLMGETAGTSADPAAASRVAECVARMLGLEVDASKLLDSEESDTVVKEQEPDKGDLSYFG